MAWRDFKFVLATLTFQKPVPPLREPRGWRWESLPSKILYFVVRSPLTRTMAAYTWYRSKTACFPQVWRIRQVMWLFSCITSAWPLDATKGYAHPYLTWFIDLPIWIICPQSQFTINFPCRSEKEIEKTIFDITRDQELGRTKFLFVASCAIYPSSGRICILQKKGNDEI